MKEKKKKRTIVIETLRRLKRSEENRTGEEGTGEKRIGQERRENKRK